MKSGKDTFQGRLGQATEARQKALEALRAKPPVDETILAERRAAQERRDAAQAQKQAARKAAIEAERAAKADAAAAKAAVKPPLTEAEKKEARDARYAARKSRGKR